MCSVAYGVHVRRFVMPHSHMDPGWIRTFEQFFNESSFNAFRNLLAKLRTRPDTRVLFAEVRMCLCSYAPALPSFARADRLEEIS